MKCTKCGKEIDNDSKFCDGCGETVVAAVTPEEKPKKKKPLGIIIGCVALAVVAVVLMIIFLGGGDDEYVKGIKTGVFEEFPEPTIGEAFESFFDDPEWDSFTTEEGLTVVEFNGVCTLDGEEADCCVQFLIAEDGSFETYYAEINEEALSEEDIVVMYEIIYGYESQGSEDEAYENALLALYNKSALPYGMSQAVSAGIYEDVSVGEMIDYMFTDPDIEFERYDEDTVIVKISGNYRHSTAYSDAPYSGTIAYYVSESGTVRLQSDPDGIKGIMETLATQLAANY